ncbi:MAG TPA: helix-turn-helix domain-containing protein [archaeon]|nr:helix-turn-helix domain-containing protein [archaeon]
MHRKRILIIDDDASLIESLSAALSPLYRVSSAANGKSALALLQTDRTDLIILDVVLGDGDGLDLLPDLRERTAAKILMLTGHGSRENLLRAIRAKPDDFLDKPVDLHTLRSRIAALLRGNAAEADPLDRVRARIAADFLRQLTIEDLARTAGMSCDHLRRTFKARFGLTPMAYLEECRMKQAAVFLRGTDKGVKEVAWDVGFRNANNFSTAFKRFYGVSPEIFRAQHRPSSPKTIP